jgi:hypothetical protein
LADDEALSHLQDQLLAVNFQRGMELAVMGERVWGLHAYGDASAGGAGKTPTVLYRAWIRDDPVAFLSMMQQFMDAVGAEWPGPLRQTEKYAALSVEGGVVPAPVGNSVWWKPTGMAGRLRRYLVEQAGRETARLRAAAAGVAAARFRQSEGRWPRSLDELAPKWIDDMPLDPFTGEPLRWTVDDDGVRIYSVGLDMVDDGGVETPEKLEDDYFYRRGKPDVVFRVRDNLVKEE